MTLVLWAAMIIWKINTYLNIISWSTGKYYSVDVDTIKPIGYGCYVKMEIDYSLTIIVHMIVIPLWY